MMLNYKEAIPDLTKSIELNFNKAENAYFNRAPFQDFIQKI